MFGRGQRKEAVSGGGANALQGGVVTGGQFFLFFFLLRFCVAAQLALLVTVRKHWLASRPLVTQRQMGKSCRKTGERAKVQSNGRMPTRKRAVKLSITHSLAVTFKLPLHWVTPSSAAPPAHAGVALNRVHLALQCRRLYLTTSQLIPRDGRPASSELEKNLADKVEKKTAVIQDIRVVCWLFWGP